MTYSKRTMTSSHITRTTVFGALTQMTYVLLSLLLGVGLVLLTQYALAGVSLYLHNPATAQKASWYGIRAAGLTSYTLLWLSTLMGLLVTARWLPQRVRALVAWHEMVSLAALLFLGWHVLALYMDSYMSVTWWQPLLPFAVSSYRPVALAWGQIGAYLMVAIILSFYVRRYIGGKRWRQLHYMTLVLYGLAFLHAVTAGSDIAYMPVRIFYVLSGSTILMLVYSRMFTHKVGKRSRPQRKHSGA